MVSMVSLLISSSCLTPSRRLRGRKYEKCKAKLQDYRSTADRYEERCREAQERAVRERQRYDMLLQHSEETLTR